MTFAVENTGLRKLRKSDAPAICRWMNDAETVKYLGYGFIKPRTLEDLAEEIRLQLEGEFTGKAMVIEDRLTHRYLGQINLMLPDERAKTAEISIVLISQARGHGIALKALRLFLNKAFNQWHYRRLYLKCLSGNSDAVKLYEKAGFRREGTLRQHIQTSEGLMDVILYGLLREEFEEKQQIE